MTWEYMMCSSNLREMDVSEIDPQLLGWLLLPDLNMGTTLADFQSSGIRPESRDCWKINARKLAECWQVIYVIGADAIGTGTGFQGKSIDSASYPELRY